MDAGVEKYVILECLYIALHPAEYKSLKSDPKRIRPRLKQFYEVLVGHPLPQNFQGLELMSTLELARKGFHLAFALYTFNKETKKYEQFGVVGECGVVVNLLVVPVKSGQHVMYIKDIEALTKLHVCPKCKVYCLSASNHGSYRKPRFDQHVENCDGKFKSELRLGKVARPYIPHIFKNPLYAYLYARGRTQEYIPINQYIVYDFETVAMKKGEKFGHASTWDSTLHPISVAWTVKAETTTTHSLYRAEMNEEEFISMFLEKVFDADEEIYNNQIGYFESLNLPKRKKQQVIGKLRDDGTKKKRESEPKPLKDDAQREEEIEEGIEQNNDDENEDRGPKHVVKVIGFNSRKFDVNLFIFYINSPKIKVVQVLRTGTQYKSLTLTHEDYPFGLQFIDLLLYLAGGTLEKNAKAFSKDVIEGVFPMKF
jgi:hypothetical protein